MLNSLRKVADDQVVNRVNSRKWRGIRDLQNSSSLNAAMHRESMTYIKADSSNITIRVAGNPKGGRPKKGSHRPPFVSKGANHSDRLVARLKRDHPAEKG